jgi:hypothetical protein
MRELINEVSAILSLVPDAKVTLRDGNIIWHEPKIPPVDAGQITREKERLLAEYDATEYQRLRQPEYPPVTDYLDAVVKGDQEQIQAYIDTCLAVKAKYPKPEGV